MPTKSAITVASIRTATYDDKASRAADPCFRCGRNIVDAAWLIHLGVDGLIHPADAVLSEDESQGWFPVGSDCAKRLTGYAVPA